MHRVLLLPTCRRTAPLRSSGPARVRSAAPLGQTRLHDCSPAQVQKARGSRTMQPDRSPAIQAFQDAKRVPRAQAATVQVQEPPRHAHSNTMPDLGALPEAAEAAELVFLPRLKPPLVPDP